MGEPPEDDRKISCCCAAKNLLVAITLCVQRSMLVSSSLARVPVVRSIFFCWGWEGAENEGGKTNMGKQFLLYIYAGHGILRTLTARCDLFCVHCNACTT